MNGTGLMRRRHRPRRRSVGAGDDGDDAGACTSKRGRYRRRFFAHTERARYGFAQNLIVLQCMTLPYG